MNGGSKTRKENEMAQQQIYKFRLLIGERICSEGEEVYKRVEFEAGSLSSARRKSTKIASDMKLEIFGKPARWEKWDSGNRRFTRRRCYQNCVLYIWLVSLDKDIRELP